MEEPDDGQPDRPAHQDTTHPTVKGAQVTHLWETITESCRPGLVGKGIADPGMRAPREMTVKGVREFLQLRQEAEPNVPPHLLIKPMFVKITGGILYPAALMKSGYWERKLDTSAMDAEKIEWLSKFQKWQYRGFSQWAPSWDFTWNLEDLNPITDKSYVVAQVGEEDEADSLPIFMPATLASKIKDQIIATGAMHVTIQGTLGHREQFAVRHKHNVPLKYESLLDFCLWLDEAKDGEGGQDHWVQPEKRHAAAEYSGYLWKCVAPKTLWQAKKSLLQLSDVFFIWAHTDFGSKECRDVDLEVLGAKERCVRSICERHGLGDDLVTLQRSSSMVGGEAPEMSPAHFYKMMADEDAPKYTA